MQQATAINLMHSLPVAVPRRNPTVAYARALTFTAWFFLLVFNYWWRQNWNDIYRMAAEGVNLKEYYYYGIAIAFVGHLTLGIGAWIQAPFAFLSSRVGKLLGAFMLLMYLLIPLSAGPTRSAYYLMATTAVIILCTLYWMSDYRIVRRVLVFSGIVLVAWILILMVHHGLTRAIAGNIGGVNRNMIGKMALAGMAMMMLADRKMIRWVGVAVAIAVSVVLTSRGTLLALGVFLGVSYALHKGTAKAAAHAAVFGVVCVTVLLASSFLQHAVLEDVLRLHDKGRGLGSGLSGRLENWSHAIGSFWDRPVVGHGYRTAGMEGQGVAGAHSGYINLLIESGVVGALLVVVSVLLSIYERAQIVWKIQPLMQQSAAYAKLLYDMLRHNVVFASYLCSVLVLWIYEPVYLNLGHVTSLLFFLALTSPTYPGVTRQDLLYQLNSRPMHAVTR